MALVSGRSILLDEEEFDYVEGQTLAQVFGSDTQVELFNQSNKPVRNATVAKSLIPPRILRVRGVNYKIERAEELPLGILVPPSPKARKMFKT